MPRLFPVPEELVESIVTTDLRIPTSLQEISSNIIKRLELDRHGVGKFSEASVAISSLILPTKANLAFVVGNICLEGEDYKAGLENFKQGLETIRKFVVSGGSEEGSD